MSDKFFFSNEAGNAHPAFPDFAFASVVRRSKAMYDRFASFKSGVRFFFRGTVISIFFVRYRSAKNRLCVFFALQSVVFAIIICTHKTVRLHGTDEFRYYAQKQ